MRVLVIDNSLGSRRQWMVECFRKILKEGPELLRGTGVIGYKNVWGESERPKPLKYVDINSSDVIFIHSNPDVNPRYAEFAETVCKDCHVIYFAGSSISGEYSDGNPKHHFYRNAIGTIDDVEQIHLIDFLLGVSSGNIKHLFDFLYGYNIMLEAKLALLYILLLPPQTAEVIKEAGARFFLEMEGSDLVDRYQEAWGRFIQIEPWKFWGSPQDALYLDELSILRDALLKEETKR
ncbi:MAG: hypothetical protein IMZ61_08275 [Planctomycetes bacterium]|nr:hypothetical protein [Planctomycetota bacterium]